MSGALRLWVHIADPTRLLQLGDAVESEARARTASCYLPTGTLPMMPMVLAAGPLSLRPGVVSCALSMGCVLGSDGSFALDELTITPSLIAAERLTYNDVDALLEDAHEDADPNMAGETAALAATLAEDDALRDALQRLRWAADARQQWRIAGPGL